MLPDRDMVYQENHFKHIYLGCQKYRIQTAVRCNQKKRQSVYTQRSIQYKLMRVTPKRTKHSLTVQPH